MYTLYYSPGACSMAVHVILNECNQPVKLERVDLQQPRSPEFLAVNSRGQVPTLVDDGFAIREGAAIIVYLLEKHKSALLPAAGKERAMALEWLAFCNATLHPAYGKGFFTMRFAPEEAKKQMLDTAIGNINKLWAEVEEKLGKTAFLAGDQITAADILMTVIANWIGYFPDPAAFKFGPRTKKLLQTVIARPAYKKALEAEKVEYKAAA